MLKVSKWIKVPLLIDEEEMADLLATLHEGIFYDVQRVVEKGEGIVSHDEYIAHYAAYIEKLKKGEVSQISLAPVLSTTPKALEKMDVGDGRQLIKPCLPVVQFQANQISYSPVDERFRSQVFGEGSISWGIMVGYPQVFQDSETLEIHTTRHFPNTPLFKAFQKWIRNHTLPTPFVIGKKHFHEPIRLGKRCFSWIGVHPQLLEHGIAVETPKTLRPQ